MNDLRVSEPKRLIGKINMALAIAGYCQLIVNAIGYHYLPPSFIDSYGSFMVSRFPAMELISVLLLTPLGVTGFLLLRELRHSLVLCNIFFVVEIISIAVLLIRWNMPFLPVSPLMIVTGLMNCAIAIQIVTLYPFIGLAIINRKRTNA